jgi:hypothetical protein
VIRVIGLRERSRSTRAGARSLRHACYSARRSATRLHILLHAPQQDGLERGLRVRAAAKTAVTGERPPSASRPTSRHAMPYPLTRHTKHSSPA